VTAILDLESRTVAVGRGQPASNRRQAHTISRHIGRARTIIGHTQPEQVVDQASADGDTASVWPVSDAMTDSVLDERLKDERWHERGERECVSVTLDAKPIAEPESFER
jgi:hypothetical protein